MCGRYTLASPEEWIRSEFGAQTLPAELRPRFNIAPTQRAPVVVLREGTPTVDLFRWGLIPFWARDPAIGNRLINARAETIHEKPAFRNAYRRQRCLVPADGFYEWQRTPRGKVPMRIRRRDGRPLAFAGLWERWEPDGADPLFTFTIVTTSANDLLRPIHDRMPVLLDAEARRRWLDPAATHEELAPLLRPCPADDLEAYAVSPLVNSPGNDVPDCNAPA